MRDVTTEKATPMGIRAVLFDADGVIQRPATDWQSALGKALGPTKDLDEFVGEVFAAERPALTGGSDFAESLREILSRWSCHGTLEDVLDVWTTIDVEEEILRAIQGLRRTGIDCYLATNQESYRAHHMSEVLGYADLFDGAFYSCQLGSMKPDAGYFRSILRQIELPPGNVLFLDDHQANVDAAQSVGLCAAAFAIEDGSNALRRTLQEFGVHIA
jgi:FMN phosphatase YigB (HAD superfamily)